MNIVLIDDLKFKVTSDIDTALSVAKDYHFNSIQPTDVVIDVGANIGGFCIRATRFSKNIFAVEPVTFDDLRQNIELNKAPIKILEGALGNGRQQTISWNGRKIVAKTYPFIEIKKMAGGCDFLKCDCEGGEWSIKPEELKGVRHIEMELHIPPISGPINQSLLNYIGEHYNFIIDRERREGIGVLGILHAEAV